jgi:hypothetical protein
MSTRTHSLPIDQTRWSLQSPTSTVFTWDYDGSRGRLLNLYEKGKNKQWNSRERIDWSIHVDPENPLKSDESTSPFRLRDLCADEFS